MAITDAQSLIAEGCNQANCVGSYAARVKDGNYYVYQVLKPERATLSIALGTDRNWRIGELKGRGNSPVSAKTRKAVNAWLAKYRISV